MTELIIIESNNMFAVDSSHIRCDGTVNLTVRMQDGSEIELFGLSLKQANNVEYNLTHPDMSVNFRPKFLVRTEELWMSQNGIIDRKEA